MTREFALKVEKAVKEKYWEGFEFALNLLDDMYAKTHPHPFNIADCIRAKANRLPKSKIRKSGKPALKDLFDSILIYCHPASPYTGNIYRLINEYKKHAQ